MLRPWRLPVFVILIPAAYVIGAYGATYAPLWWLTRPLAISVLGAMVLLLVARVLARAWTVAGFVAGLVLWLISGFAVAMLLLAWIVVARRVSPRLRRWPLPSASSLTTGLNLFASVWLAIAVSTAVLVVARPVVAMQPAINLDPNATASRPDIYLILLDGHARVDTLASFGFDDEPFLQALEARGFDVYRDARGSYRLTGEVLASLVNGRQLSELPINPPGLIVDQYGYLMDMIHDAPLLDELRGLGYQIVTSAPPYGLVALDTADVYLDDGEPNDFELSLLGNTALAGILNIVAPKLPHEWQASRIQANLADLRSVASREDEQPVFMLAHVTSPHPPYVFDANGSILPPLPCYPASCARQRDSNRPDSRAVRSAVHRPSLVPRRACDLDARRRSGRPECDRCRVFRPRRSIQSG